jgi:acetyltransferase
MMQAKLKRALNATRIAVVGASPEQLSVGLGPLYNLTRAPFGGAILPVNPKYDSILGLKCSPDLESLDPPPELAILLVNQHLAVEMTERAARCGVQAVVIVAGGFKEVREGGLELEVRLREVAERTQTPVIGPNTLGASAFHRGLHGIFWHLDASSGSVAVISQSGGVGLTVAYGLRQLHCGLSHLIGVGNRSVVDFADYLEVLKDDPGVRAFCLFLEGLEEPRGLYEAARGITTSKPIVVYKAGKNQAVARATATHTGSLTGDYRLYRAMFAQAGMVEVSSSREAAVAVKALSMLPQPTGNRLCALTFTAGPAIVAMDLLISGGWELPDLSAATKRRVEGIIGEKTPVDLQNPIDLTGPGFLPHTYGRVLEAILAEDVDAYFLVWNFNPLIRFPLAELSTFRDKAARPVVLVLLAHAVEADPHLRECARRSLCAYLTPEDGATALNAMLTDTRARERLLGRRFP